MSDYKIIIKEKPKYKSEFKEVLNLGSGGAIIDDNATSTDKTWSSQKISDELSTKANTKHSHKISDVNNLQSKLDKKLEKFTTYTADDIVTINSDGTIKDSGKKLSDYALINHTHTDIRNAINSKPDIDDTTPSTTKVYSSQKTEDLLSAKATLNTNVTFKEMVIDPQRTTGYEPFIYLLGGKEPSNAGSIVFIRDNVTQQQLFEFRTTLDAFQADGFFGTISNIRKQIVFITGVGVGSGGAFSVDEVYGLCIGTNDNILNNNKGYANIFPNGSAKFKNIASNIKLITTDYNITKTDFTILCDCSSNNININLLDNMGEGSIIVIKKIDSSLNTVIINTTLFIDNLTSYTLAAQNQTIRLQKGAGQWWVI